MAGALRDAFLSAGFQFLFDSCKSYFSGTTNSDLDIGELREKLELVLNTVSADLEDAEQKQLRGDQRVEEWIDTLQEAIFDAEDLLDETHALQPEAVEPKSKPIMSTIRDLLSPSTTSNDPHLGKRIKKILTRLETIAAHRSVLDRKKGVGKIPLRRETTPLIDDSEVYGRDGERNALKEMLLSDECGSGKIGVIPIVGMGGLGKTTLAQAVFNDNDVKNDFEPKAWVCVSEEKEVCKVLKMLYEAIARADCDLKRLYELQSKIQDMLKEKKFLIVLDDIWNEDRDFWEKMSILFKAGAQGSKIIVTSRSEKVANITGTLPTHHLQKLEEDACLKLFEKHAYGCEDFDSNPDLKRIGIEIVKKCKGLPLAVKAFGGLLNSTSDVEEWKRIAESNISALSDEGNNILPALRLSYYYLPSHLKKCFAYCAMFPKDYVFQKEKLIRLWMAENLLKCSGENRRMEEVGDTYFKDLVSRSFFQPSEFKPSSYVMHDLMVDLAKSISGKYCCQLSIERNSDKIEMKTRHLAYEYIEWHDSNDERFNHVFEATRLRTFLSLGYSSCSDEVVHNVLLKLKCLRVLSFPNSEISALSDSIGELKHLRYLDLSRTNIMMLPESISVLYNLQTLKLKYCYSLEKLPEDVHNLINLRYLDVRGCRKLEEMPRQVSKLKNLQMLSIFIVGNDSGTKIGELGELSELRGELFIKNLENVGNVEDASDRANLKDKKHLAKLRLEWNNNCTIDESTHARDVLEMLVPNAKLKELEILDYPGTEFPNWVGDDSYRNIVFLDLSGCSNCRSLPPLGQLASLKTLFISYFEAVVNVGSEFYGSARNPFPSLEILKLNYMPSWEHWQCNTIEVQEPKFFSNLRDLGINSCKKLTLSLPHFLASLTRLEVSWLKFSSPLPIMPRVPYLYFDGCENLVFQEKSLSEALYHSLERLQIFRGCGDSFRSVSMDFFPNLKTLVIYYCDSFESLCVSDGQCLSSLSSLEISDCPNFVSFPKGGLPAPNLTSLGVNNCKKLKRLPEKMHELLTSLQSLDIRGCTDIETFPEGGLPLSLTELGISSCYKLIALWSNLQTPPNLETLVFWGNEVAESFPEEGLLPATVVTTTTLQICNFEKLRELYTNRLQQFTSLKKLGICACPELQTMTDEEFPASLEELDIQFCRKLQTLPEQGLPTSLRCLWTYECPLLEKLCRPNGQYWSKIHHINEIRINGKDLKSETSTSY